MWACFICIYLHASPMMLSEAGGQYSVPPCQAPGPWDQTTLISKGQNQNTKHHIRIVRKIK